MIRSTNEQFIQQETFHPMSSLNCLRFVVEIPYFFLQHPINATQNYKIARNLPRYLLFYCIYLHCRLADIVYGSQTVITYKNKLLLRICTSPFVRCNKRKILGKCLFFDLFNSFFYFFLLLSKDKMTNQINQTETIQSEWKQYKYLFAQTHT